MTKIIVIDDDPGIRNNLRLILKAEGHDVQAAENGRAGLEAIQKSRPDLVICDVMMPLLDGFGVLEALRKIPGFADLPFIFLTALDDRTSLRKGMNLGADDYLNKPFTREDLIDAIGTRLKKHESAVLAVAERLLSRDDELMDRFRARAPVDVSEKEAMKDTGRMIEATVLFSDIRNFTTLSERLTATQVAELLNAYFERACGAIVRHGGRVAKLLGDGIMAIFERDDSITDSHAARAIRGALDIALEAYKFRDWIRHHYEEHALPEFSVGTGLHTGEIIYARIGPPGSEAWAAVGDAVNVASRVEGKTKDLGWPVIASAATVAAAGARLETGDSARVELRGRERPMEIVEIRGIADVVDRGVASVELSAAVRSALAANASAAARASKEVLNETLRSITADLTKRLLTSSEPLTVRGYRILSKIGQGGMSHVYLAKRDADGLQLVLKVLNARPTDDPELFQRFMGEIAIISEINHHNVVRIYDHGFTESYAYIAMEYFSRGTLYDIIKHGLSPRQTLSLLAQLAGALSEIHRRGIVHRDMKPANVMVREDGSIALADFGIAKKLEAASGPTRHGEVLGTPYYISPEIIEGEKATAQSDLYALGVMFYEMLLGARPFEADSVSGLIAQHLKAPIPRLPGDLADYQDLIDRLLAKVPSDRYQSSDDLLVGIDEIWTRLSIRAMGDPRPS